MCIFLRRQFYFLGFNLLNLTIKQWSYPSSGVYCGSYVHRPCQNELRHAVHCSPSILFFVISRYCPAVFVSTLCQKNLLCIVAVGHSVTLQRDFVKGKDVVESL